MPEHLFAYGTLQPGHAPAAMRDVVERMRPLGPATVRGRLYDLGSYPGLILDPDAGPVKGQLLALPADPESLLRLDAYEGFLPDDPHRSLFRRVRCAAALHSGESLDCWVYVYNGDVAGPRLIEGGEWRPRRVAIGLSPRAEPDRERESIMSEHRRPVIGVTLGYAGTAESGRPTRYELPMDYATSVERAGGLPLAVPYRTDLSLIPEIVDRFDGFLFTGGDDLDPALYGGGDYHQQAERIDPDRQRFELALLAEVERRRAPALGVCLGSQLMNVHRGGSLIQFLPEHARDGAIEHRKAGDDGRRHVVRIEPGTVLASAIGKEQIVANTRHKQAVQRVGRGLRVNAYAPDGVVEGIEDPSLPLFLAVQWHPENLSDQPEHLAPFKLLVDKARTTRPRRA